MNMMQNLKGQLDTVLHAGINVDGVHLIVELLSVFAYGFITIWITLTLHASHV